MQRAASYDEAIGRKYPEQVVIAIARDSDGKFNPITLGWVMCTSGKPPMMAISPNATTIYCISSGATSTGLGLVVSIRVPAGTVVKAITVGKWPSAIAIAP